MAASLRKWTVAGIVMVVVGFISGWLSYHFRMEEAHRTLEKNGEGRSGELSAMISRILAETAITSVVILAGLVILIIVGCVSLKRRNRKGVR